ncbi:hypothetical protein [Kangiella koreensis]|uniref:Uncharacterized protein n=1 Tax=Kangiella koreensis (strain DSM 16069 / JCM 12317 / KCTC 12182 / SW-125) TaxID=523791 RepID=C7R635_KANKD|nr:hypothetical protein [Kangiella koreensis]ACV25466.1 conserved hypothetical protein [Kangiella koreensis DSM 16069]
MDTNAQNTLVTVFQHVDIFCTMLDHYSDQTKTVVGFETAAYESVVSQYVIKRIERKTDQKRIKAALSIANMQECGLLSFINHKRGQFGLNRGLLQTIQNLDSRRIRELGKPDLDIIYVQMKKLYDYFIPLGGAYERGNDTFNENLASLMDTLQEVLSKIDHNAKALDGSSKRLSEILDSHNFNKMVMTDQVSSALDEIIRISQRTIKPTLIFLNEKGMVQDKSAMYLIRRIRESFERTSFYNEYGNIYTIEMKLLSYAEVIGEIRRKLSRYVEMDRLQRQIYNSIESRFNRLYTEVVTRLDTKLKGKSIPFEHTIFSEAKKFKGLVNWNSSKITGALIELPESSRTKHLEEYIRAKMQHASALNAKKRKPGENGKTARERHENYQRVNRIKKIMERFEPMKDVNDLYFAIHEHLKEGLKGYDLRDIYDAVPFVDETIKRTQTFKRGTIEYKSKRLSYLVKSLEFEKNE